jgi:hypothetical protein
MLLYGKVKCELFLDKHKQAIQRDRKIRENHTIRNFIICTLLTSNPQAGEPPLVSCPRLLIQYIGNYLNYLIYLIWQLFPSSALWGPTV